MIHSCTFTRRVLLRVVGSLHNISGKMLGVLQIKACLIYGKVCQQIKDLGWDSPITQPDLVKMMQQLLYDIIQVKEELVPFDRAWIKENYQLDMIIGPYDGSIEGYGGLQYCRSFNEQTSQYDCNLASAMTLTWGTTSSQPLFLTADKQKWWSEASLKSRKL